MSNMSHSSFLAVRGITCDVFALQLRQSIRIGSESKKGRVHRPFNQLFPRQKSPPRGETSSTTSLKTRRCTASGSRRGPRLISSDGTRLHAPKSLGDFRARQPICQVYFVVTLQTTHNRFEAFFSLLKLLVAYLRTPHL